MADTSQSSPPTKKVKRAHGTAPTTNKQAAAAGVLEYLQSRLTVEELGALYTDAQRGKFVCRAILQTLPAAAQQVVVRLACCGGSFPKTGVQVWTKLDVDTVLIPALQPWSILQLDDNKDTLRLTEDFQKGLMDSLQNLEASPFHPLSKDDILKLQDEATAAAGKPVQLYKTPEDLEQHTQTQWDAVLHYLVGTPNLKVEPNPAITHFLLQTKLMQADPDYRGSNPDHAPLVITQKGYDFMLQDTTQQVWHFVVQYLKSIESHKKASLLKKEALLLLICLSFSRLGDCYSANESLSKEGRTIMQDFSLFGLLYVHKVAGKNSVFYPTRIALQLVGGATRRGGAGLWAVSDRALSASLAHPTPQKDASAHLAIIVQTNFQLCAYTTSELHVSMLGLFCDVGTIRRLPNMVFMSMTRDSVKAAFALGIQARQILRFLEKHAHPQLRNPDPSHPTMSSPIPPNVVDQVFLWDRERHRVVWQEVFPHQCLLGAAEFQAVYKFASKVGAHVWSSAARNQLYLAHSHAPQIQAFVQKWRAKAAAARES